MILRMGFSCEVTYINFFDQGYITVDAQQLKVVVSNRIREEFENGQDYDQLHGRSIRLPNETSSLPSREYLAFHNTLFR